MKNKCRGFNLAALVLAWSLTPIAGHAACVASAASLKGWYGMLVAGQTTAPTPSTKYLVGAVLFDGVSSFSGSNLYGAAGAHTAVSGSYVLNSDCTITLTTSVPAAATYTVAVKVSGEAVGIETDANAVATVSFKPQYATYTTGLNFTQSSLNGSFVASCGGFLGAYSDLNLAVFSNGTLTGSDPYNNAGSFQTANNPYAGTYVVNPDGTFKGTLIVDGTNFDYYGVISTANSKIDYIYANVSNGTPTTVFASCSGGLAPSSGLRLVPVAPQRLVDTRNANGAFGGPELAAGGSRSFVLANADGSIPSTALAYSLNVTVVPSGRLRSLTVYPAGLTPPPVPLLSSDGRIKAQATIVQAGTGGAITVAASDATHVIIDVSGYFVAGSNAAGLTFYPVTPVRLYDTRGTGNTLISGQTRNFAIQSAAGVPANAQAYSLNITAIPKPSMSDLVVWPTGLPKPGTSTLNTKTDITANAAIVGAGSGGSISLNSPWGSTDILIDINGYWAPSALGGLSLYPVTPTRIYTSGGANVTGTITVPAPASVPTNAESLLLDATVVPPGPFGHMTLWAAGTSQPNTSTLNADDGASTSNTAVVGTTHQSFSMFLQNPTQVTFDLYGYFAP